MSIDNDKKDILDFFDDGFEVTCEIEVPEKQVDVADDGYKDVLEALSELDNTHKFDYLEANKTRTINLEEYLQAEREVEARMEAEAPSPLEKALESCKKIIHTFTPGKK